MSLEWIGAKKSGGEKSPAGGGKCGRAALGSNMFVGGEKCGEGEAVFQDCFSDYFGHYFSDYFRTTFRTFSDYA